MGRSEPTSRVGWYHFLDCLKFWALKSFQLLWKKKKRTKERKGSYGRSRIYRMIKKSVIFSHPSLPLHTYDDIVLLQLQTFFVVIKFRSQKIIGQ
jgi:hypothetical protein